MKKTLQRSLCLCLALLMLAGCLGCLTSCSYSTRISRMSEENRAVGLYDTALMRMGRVKSYTTEQTVTISALVYSEPMTIETVATETVTGLDKEESFVYTVNSTTTVTEGDAEASVTRYNEGYIDGKMYTTYEDDDRKTYLFSELTAEEYVAFLNEQSAEGDFRLTNEAAASRVCTQQEDGTWVATFSELTDDSIAYFASGILGNTRAAYLGAYTIEDVVLTFKADEDVYPISMTIEFVFDEADGAAPPEVTVETVYKNIDSTEQGEALDFSTYEQVDDLRTVRHFATMLDNNIHAISGSADVQIQQLVKYAGQSSRYDAAYNGSFSRSASGLIFDFENSIDGVPYDISYADGTYQITDKVGDPMTNTSMTEDEALMQLTGILDPAAFNITNITDVAVDEEKGVYTFTLYPDEAMLAEMLDAVDGKLSSAQSALKATVQDGVLTKYEYTYDATIKIGNQTMTFSLTAVCIYSDMKYTAETTEAI